MQSFLPYVQPLGMAFVFKCCLKKAPKTPLVFKIERKYALILVLCTICFFYGLAIPGVFFVTMVSFALQYVIDRLIITYLLEFPPVHDDLLNLKFIRILKYIAVIYLPSIFGLALFLKLFPWTWQI